MSGRSKQSDGGDRIARAWSALDAAARGADPASRLHGVLEALLAASGAAGGRLLDAEGAELAQSGEAAEPAATLDLAYGGESVGRAELGAGDTPPAPLLASAAAMVAAETARADRAEARRAEAELAESKLRYDLAVNGSHIAIWDWDVRTGALVWSQELYRMLGLAPGETAGRFEDFSERVHPADRARVQAALNAHLQTGAVYDVVFRMQHASGRWTPVHGRGDSVRDAHGRALRMAGSILDLTAAEEAERTAAEALAKISLAARHAGIGPIEIDFAAGTIRGEETLARLIGRPNLRELSIEDALQIVHPDDREAVGARLFEFAEGAETFFESAQRLVRPDGEVVWVNAVATVTRQDEAGRPRNLSGVVIDHTGHKRIECALAQANERYDIAVSASHLAVWDQRLATGDVYWSSRLGEILGLGRVEGREHITEFAARIHPDDRRRTRTAFRALVERDAPYDITMRLRRADGAYVPVRSRGGALRDETGAAVRVCGSLNDISAEVMARARADIAMEAAALGIWDWDVVSGTMTVDQRFAAMLGRPWLAAGTAPVKEPLRFVAEPDRAAARRQLSDLQAGRVDRVEFEHRAVRPDGGEVWLGGCASVVESDAEGRPRRVLGVFEDRTARKTSEMDLSEAKQRYDLAVTGAHTAIWDQDLRTGQLYWSARLGEMLGLGAVDRTEPVEDFVARIHPEDQARARAQTHIAIENDVPLDHVVRVRRVDGSYRHLRSRAGVLRDETGRPVRLCGSITDVTEEVESETKARLAGRRAQMALKAAHLGVWEFDAATGIVTADITLAKLLGQPDLAGRPLQRDDILGFAHSDDARQVRADIAKLHKGESSVCNEHRVVRADGAVVWVRADVGVAERSPDGAVGRLIGIVQDLSAVKLTEELLRKSADAARRANEAKSQFLATMSHEIRTPLNGVLGVVQLLERTSLDPRQQRYVETIKASGRSLSDVIEDVLDISRIEAGKLQLKPEPAVLVDILEQAAAPSRALAAEKGVQLTLSVDAALDGPVRIDPRRVGQMIANLIGNAVKFTEAGGVRVTAGRPARGVLRVEVDDDGPGLPEDMHEAVFERFTQADMSASRTHQGSGLGLAIVRELAKLAGGVAGVRSRPGEGACFWIELPAPAAAAGGGDLIPREDAGTTDPLRVLVVEDHPVNRAVMAELMSQNGHVCDTVDTGEEALSVMRSKRFDVVLLDLHMPGMDGRETLAHIRGGSAGASDTPVYIVSADATPEAREETQALGADGFFVKPIEADALLRALATVRMRSREAG